MRWLWVLVLILCPASAWSQDRRDEDPSDTLVFHFPWQPELIGSRDSLIVQLRYPAEALADSVEGRVFVQMLVGEDGHPREAVVTRSPDERLNAEALRFASLARFRWPDYVPVEKREIRWTIPITFSIPD